MSEQESRPKRKYRRSFVWPIVLITVGVIFLLSNLGFFGEDIWDNIWQLWPVIFIVIGLDSLFRRYEIAGPVFMIGLGVVILMSTAGLIGWETWDILWRLWPILLVAVGLEIIIGHRSLWVSLLVVGVIVALLGGVIWSLRGEFKRGEELAGERVNQPLEGINQAKITISPGVGNLEVDGLEGSTDLVSGMVRTGSNLRVITDYQVSDSTGNFRLESRLGGAISFSTPWDWKLSLTEQIPLNVNLGMGVGDMNVDLSGMSLTALDLSQGVGEIDVTLAGRENYSGDISQAIGKIVVEVPEGAGVRIGVSRAISALNMPVGFQRSGDYYYSTNYDQAEYQIDLEISQAIGEIDIRLER